MFLEGVFYVQKIEGYRTPKHNSFLHLINTEIGSYKNEKNDKKDEEDPEYMFQDWENIPSALIGESWLSENIYEWIDKFADLSDPENTAFTIWLDDSGNNIASEDAESMYDDFTEGYQGQYDSEEDFAQQIMAEIYEIPDYLRFYIDYEKYARDLFISDYWYDDGYVFRR